MLSIRLSRVGKKKQPSYRLIVLDKRKDPWGDYLENLGFYNPRAKPKVIQLKEERIKYWLGVGAQPSTTAHNLFIDAKIISGPKRKAAAVRKKTEEIQKKESKVDAKPGGKIEGAIEEKPAETPASMEEKPTEILVKEKNNSIESAE